MEVMFDRVAGLDVGKESVTVCVRTPGSRRGRHSETRTFKTMVGRSRRRDCGDGVDLDVLEAAGAPRGAVESSGGEKTPPLACRGWPVKLGAA
jgi:transposase